MSHDIFSAFSSEELQSALDSKLFRGMLDAMPIAVAVLEAEHDNRGTISFFRYRFANKTAQRMASSPLQDKRVFLNDDALLFNTMSDVVKTGSREDFLYHFQGEPERWIHYSISRFGLGVMLTYENVTERKKAALILQRERAQMAEAQAISNTGSFEWDLIAKKVYWSDEMYRIHSLEPQSQEIDSESVCGFIHPDDAIRIRKKIENYSKMPGREEMVYKLKLPNGQIRHIRTRLESFRGKTGRITHISGMAQDVTERKQTEDELRAVSDLLRKHAAGSNKREAALEDFGRIIGSVHDAIISIDTKGYIVTWNAGAERIYGYSPGEAIGRHLGRLIVPDDQQDALMEMLTKVLKNGESILELVTTKKCKDNSLIEVTSNIVPLKDASGKITGAAATSKNVSEIRKANQQLKKMNELLDLKNTIHSKAEITGNFGTWDWNPSTGEAHYSDNMFRLLGMQPGEAEPGFETIDPFIHRDDREKLSELMQELQKNPTETATVDYRVTRKDGSQRIFCNRVSITKNGAGHDVYIGITEDVTERRNVEAKVLQLRGEISQQTEEKYRTLVKAVDEGFVLYELMRDERGNVVDIVWHLGQCSRIGKDKDNFDAVDLNDIDHLKHTTDTAERQISESDEILKSMTTATPDIMFVMDINTKKVLFATKNIAEEMGYTKEQIAAMPEPFLEIMHPDDRLAMIRHVEQMKTAADGEVREIRYRIIHADGSIHWFIDRNTVFKRDENGVPCEKMGIAHDINSRVDDDEKIRMLNKSLFDKNRELRLLHNDLKTLTSVAAHDYRETLQTLYTNLEFVISRDAHNISNPGKANLRKAQTAIQKMKLLTDDIVAFSKIKAPDEKPSPVDLNEILGTVLEELSEKIAEASAEIKPDKLPVIDGYGYLLELLFYHLIDNAIKFRNPEKKLEISITSDTSNDKHTKQPVYRVSVSDNGIGFEQQFASKIFDMFYRIHDKKYKGSGIGLPICKKIADLHGGTMAIESQPGQGTMVCCFFPMT